MNRKEFWKEWNAFHKEYKEKHNPSRDDECRSLFNTYMLAKTAKRGNSDD